MKIYTENITELYFNETNQECSSTLDQKMKKIHRSKSIEQENNILLIAWVTVMTEKFHLPTFGKDFAPDKAEYPEFSQGHNKEMEKSKSIEKGVREETKNNSIEFNSYIKKETHNSVTHTVKNNDNISDILEGRISLPNHHNLSGSTQESTILSKERARRQHLTFANTSAALLYQSDSSGVSEKNILNYVFTHGRGQNYVQISSSIQGSYSEMIMMPSNPSVSERLNAALRLTEPPVHFHLQGHDGDKGNRNQHSELEDDEE